jgi:hypothetical protein
VRIRIWDGCAFICELDVSRDGYTISGPAGGAEHAGRPDVEYDPWAGCVVDHNHAPGEVVTIEPAP